MNTTSCLLVPFLTDDPQFTLGFECGQVFEFAMNNIKITNKPCHMENKQQIELILNRLNVKHEIKDMQFGWFNLNTYPSKLEDIAKKYSAKNIQDN